jgi:hypothetical protein
MATLVLYFRWAIDNLDVPRHMVIVPSWAFRVRARPAESARRSADTPALVPFADWRGGGTSFLSPRPPSRACAVHFPWTDVDRDSPGCDRSIAPSTTGSRNGATSYSRARPSRLYRAAHPRRELPDDGSLPLRLPERRARRDRSGGCVRASGTSCPPRCSRASSRYSESPLLPKRSSSTSQQPIPVLVGRDHPRSVDLTDCAIRGAVYRHLDASGAIDDQGAPRLRCGPLTSG